MYIVMVWGWECSMTYSKVHLDLERIKFRIEPRTEVFEPLGRQQRLALRPRQASPHVREPIST